jgi:NDP-sugar pyrophosphorylase family protein
MNIESPENMAGLVLAAGRGERLRPITDSVPKPLIPIGRSTLLDMAIASMPMPTSSISVNAHYLSGQIVQHLEDSGVHVEVELEALASAGAVANLRSWIAGRNLMIRNADMWFDRQPYDLWDGWSGEHPRLLVQETGQQADFGTARFLGWSLLPSELVESLPDGRSGLLDQVWKPALLRGELELVPFDGVAIDAGTPDDLDRLRQRVERT